MCEPQGLVTAQAGAHFGAWLCSGGSGASPMLAQPGILWSIPASGKTDSANSHLSAPEPANIPPDAVIASKFSGFSGA